MSARITKVQDDGQRFIIHGTDNIRERIKEVFDQIGPGISVTDSDNGEANIFYTENNRDIVLRVLHDHTKT